jgi:hypothetical protein
MLEFVPLVLRLRPPPAVLGLRLLRHLLLLLGRRVDDTSPVPAIDGAYPLLRLLLLLRLLRLLLLLLLLLGQHQQPVARPADPPHLGHQRPRREVEVRSGDPVGVLRVESRIEHGPREEGAGCGAVPFEGIREAGVGVVDGLVLSLGADDDDAGARRRRRRRRRRIR